MLIGLGKHRGAAEYHRAFGRVSFDRIVAEVGPRVAQACRVLCGVAVVENHRHETGLIEIVGPARFTEREAELLRLAQAWMPRLPGHRPAHRRPHGQGDIGQRHGHQRDRPQGLGDRRVHRAAPAHRSRLRARSDRGFPRQRRRHRPGGSGPFASDPEDRLPDHLHERADLRDAAGSLDPPHLPSDREALAAALQTLGALAPGQLRVVRIRSTRDLEELLVSEGLLAETRRDPELTVEGKAQAMRFDAAGDLADW